MYLDDANVRKVSVTHNSNLAVYVHMFSRDVNSTNFAEDSAVMKF